MTSAHQGILLGDELYVSLEFCVRAIKMTNKNFQIDPLPMCKKENKIYGILFLNDDESNNEVILSPQKSKNERKIIESETTISILFGFTVSLAVGFILYNKKPKENKHLE